MSLDRDLTYIAEGEGRLLWAGILTLAERGEELDRLGLDRGGPEVLDGVRDERADRSAG